jgi:hypothetical protein
LIDEACAAIGRNPATLRRSYPMFERIARDVIPRLRS